MEDETKERGDSGFWEREQEMATRAEAARDDERIRYYSAELQALKAYMNGDDRRFAAQVTEPTLIVHGGRDRVVPCEWAEELHRLIGQSELRVIEDESHGVIWRSAEARALILRFLH